MSEKEIEQNGASLSGEKPAKQSRALFTRRNALIAGVSLVVLALLLSLIAFVLYRSGTVDSYVKTQFVEKMSYMGIVFDTDVFRLRVSPLQLELKNATFNDRISGEKLFFIRDARIGLTVQNLYAWQLTRDIDVNATEINGAEVWVKFDKEGRSNFSNLVQDERTANLNFKYNSIRFSLKDSVVHFGDLSRTISGDANNILLFLEPENLDVPDEEKRYKIDFTSTGSNFVYDQSTLSDITIRAVAIADGKGAEITDLQIKTPIGVSNLNGTLTDWPSPKYSLNIESTVDLTQTSTIFPFGAALRGVGSFKGNVAGEGETYRINGVVDSESITAEKVYLKGINIAATVEGTNTNYEANGNAVAELLTFENFRIDFPKMAGNVRGIGSDFRWVGELQAVAAKSGSLTLVGLFLSDAVAEYKDRELTASTGSVRAQKFSISDTEFGNLAAGNIRFSQKGDVTGLSAPNATADSMKTPDYKIDGLSGRNVRARIANDDTRVEIDNLTARGAALKGNKARNLLADSFDLKVAPDGTSVTLKNMQAEQIDASGTKIIGASAPLVEIRDNSVDTRVYADRLRVAGIEGGGAVLGSMNIAGVRLTIREGTVEGTSDDIDAGSIALNKNSLLADGGTLEGVKIRKPIFVVEPSGRYRASADMSIGGGIVGKIPLGAATAKVDVNNDRVELNELNASVMGGSVNGTAVVAFSDRNQSRITADFSNLDLSKLAAIQGGRVIPFEGQATGRADISFNGTDIRSASGKINADIIANAGNADSGMVPVTGKVELSAAEGLFNVDLARLNTEKSELSATGRFDLRNDDSDLDFALDSNDASEIERLVRVLGIAPAIEEQLDSLDVTVAGNMNFNGKITGNLADPTVDGKASLSSISLREREIGSVKSDIYVSPEGTELRNGILLESTGGGTAVFSVSIPNGGANNTSVRAELTNINAGNLLTALPFEIPERLRDFNGLTSGTVNLSGLPNQARGDVNLAAASGTVAGQEFDSLKAKAIFSGTLIDLESGEIRLGNGFVSAKGRYDRASTAFDFDVSGKSVPLPLALAFLPKGDSIPTIAGSTDFAAKASGESERPATYNVNFSGSAREVVVNENAFGSVEFKGTTANQILNADLTAILDGREQVINSSVNFANDNLPFRIETAFDKSPLKPFFALVPQLRGISIGGTGTGQVEFGGNLSQMNAEGIREFSTASLSGTARFTQLDLKIQDTPLIATEAVVVRFDPKEINFESARFSGGGSNVVIAGTKAITDDGINNLAIDGRINLALLNAVPAIASTDTFFGGFTNVAVRLAGVNRTARISGTARMENAAVAAFVGSSRLTFDRLQGRILFTSNQAQIEQATGYLGGGKFNASGGALFGDNLQLDSFRVALDGNNVTVPLPEDFITTGDARIEISGVRPRSDLLIQIAGTIRARRSLYTKDIELANIVGARREGSLSVGPSSLRAPIFDLTIEGRDALIVRNNIADLTASVSLRLTGTTDNPQLSGRITANSGTVFFRKDRYIVQRGVLEFPPDTAIEPILNLQAESEIQGYQIFVNLSGSLNDTETLVAGVRSSPALPQQDIISLITTGNLSNTESGIPTFAQTGINTAAEILTDSIINNPARKATDKLFGLNVFEIDPIISGERLNPSARLTVGRQINNNLRVTYATNLSQDQNQVLALEYRVSNKLSFVAQYEQRSLSNVTSDRDNFSLEIRFRRRF